MFKFIPLAVAVLTLGAGSAQAGPAIVSFSVGSQFTVFSTDETVGWTFRVGPGTGVSVNALGWWDASPTTPLEASHAVGIWDLNGVLLGSATVMPGDPLSGSFRWASVTSFVLAANTTYVIGGRDLSSDGDTYSSFNGSLVMDPSITFLQAARSANGTGFSFPTTYTANSGGRFGPNFSFEPAGQVPEPGTWGLAGLALLALGASRRRAG